MNCYINCTPRNIVNLAFSQHAINSQINNDDICHINALTSDSGDDIGRSRSDFSNAIAVVFRDVHDACSVVYPHALCDVERGAGRRAAVAVIRSSTVWYAGECADLTCGNMKDTLRTIFASKVNTTLHSKPTMGTKYRENAHLSREQQFVLRCCQSQR